MNTTSLFKFATLRSPSDAATLPPKLMIHPASPLVTDIIAINEGNDASAQKLVLVNRRLQAYIDSKQFIKTKTAFYDALSQSGTEAFYNRLFDNVVVRTITKSTTNQVYKLLV